jgi:hypothetical protein
MKNRARDINQKRGNSRHTGTSDFSKIKPKVFFVAFIDILGFGQKVQDDFEGARRDYDILINHMSLINSSKILKATIRMISDSIYITGENPSAVIETAHYAQQGILFSSNWLSRGAIAAGPHQELNHNGNLFIVSEPLVNAIKTEKIIKKPCIVLHPSAVPSQLIYNGAISNFERSIFFYDGHWIVNPFNVIWGLSAAERVKELKRSYPKFVKTYDWFLELYNAVKNEEILLPGYLKEEGRCLRKKGKKIKA